MYTATQLLIATLTITPATDGVRDLCDVVHRKTGTPTICRPHKEGAPVYDANVCCSGSTCFPTVRGRCRSDETLYFCGLGELTPTGEVACYFEVPNYCDVFVCELGTAPPVWEDELCCQGSVCTALSPYVTDCPIDDIYWCSSVASNADGSVTCVDWEE